MGKSWWALPGMGCVFTVCFSPALGICRPAPDKQEGGGGGEVVKGCRKRGASLWLLQSWRWETRMVGNKKSFTERYNEYGFLSSAQHHSTISWHPGALRLTSLVLSQQALVVITVGRLVLSTYLVPSCLRHRARPGPSGACSSLLCTWEVGTPLGDVDSWAQGLAGNQKHPLVKKMAPLF